jgi:outer membrane lipoprotein-sorting protein
MKKTIALIAAMMFISGIAFAADFQGKVTKVKGKNVTIEITKGKAAKIKVGSKVKLELDDAAA